MESGCSLLLVDDDEEFLEILCRRFRRRGLLVASAIDPQAAIEAASRETFHVAVVDRSLPGQDGVDLMLRLIDRHPQLRVILLSGHGDEEAIAQARNRGAFEYLVKPCAFADLEAAVTRAYQASRAPAPQ
jgi:DNA-binding NtrC family response regulator